MARKPTPKAKLAPRVATNLDTLLGSSSLPATFEIGGATVQLGTIVLGAHKASGLSLEEWNNLDEVKRDMLLVDELERLKVTGTTADPIPATSTGSSTAAEESLTNATSETKPAAPAEEAPAQVGVVSRSSLADGSQALIIAGMLGGFASTIAWAEGTTDEVKTAVMDELRFFAQFADRGLLEMGIVKPAAPDAFAGWEYSDKWGGYALLEELRQLMRRWEQLPASSHQSAVIARLGAAAFGIQQLQMTDDHYWPVSAVARLEDADRIIPYRVGEEGPEAVLATTQEQLHDFLGNVEGSPLTRIKVAGPKVGRRRAGYVFTEEPVEISVTADELAAIESDASLEVRRLLAD